MKRKASLRAAAQRDRNLQIVPKGRNKAGKYVGRLIIKMRNRRQNGKAGRYAVSQG